MKYNGGFGNHNNTQSSVMLGGTGYLYIGMDNDSDGASVFLAQTDGTAYDFTNGNNGGQHPIFQGTTSETRISSMVLYNGYIYIGVHDETNGGKIYKASHSMLLAETGSDPEYAKTGNPDTGWADITSSITGFSSSSTTNIDVTAMRVYNGDLWLGTENANGAQLWNYDGSVWSKVFDYSGYDSTNRSIEFIQENALSNLYIGTRKNPGSGAEIWKSTDAGLSFNQIGMDGFGDTQLNACSAATSTGSIIYITINDETTPKADVFRYAE